MGSRSQPSFTFSAGIGDPDVDSFHDAINSADTALLQAKQAGRDRIVAACAMPGATI